MILGVFLSCSPPCILRWGPELTNLARLVGQQAPGICLCPQQHCPKVLCHSCLSTADLLLEGHHSPMLLRGMTMKSVGRAKPPEFKT